LSRSPAKRRDTLSFGCGENLLLRRIHITGGPGAGKSWLAARLSDELRLPLFDIDGRGLAHEAKLPDPSDMEELLRLRLEETAAIAAHAEWISEGANFLAAEPFFQHADLIICLEVRWRVASYRIFSRHVKANLAGNNRFPGWQRLWQFWRWSARFYSSRNPQGLNQWGTPNNHRDLEARLRPYAAKVAVCRNLRDVKRVLSEWPDD
jgi:adenylate kinase family enzyme